jgi:hypothetical protein
MASAAVLSSLYNTLVAGTTVLRRPTGLLAGPLRILSAVRTPSFTNFPRTLCVNASPHSPHCGQAER